MLNDQKNWYIFQNFEKVTKCSGQKYVRMSGYPYSNPNDNLSINIVLPIFRIGIKFKNSVTEMKKQFEFFEENYLLSVLNYLIQYSKICILNTLLHFQNI